MSEIIITAVISSLASMVITGVTFWLVQMKNWVSHHEIEPFNTFLLERGSILNRLSNIENDNNKLFEINERTIDAINEFKIEISKFRTTLEHLQRKM